MAIIQEACSDIGQIKKKFVHLHLHTTYSLLDGAQLVGDIKSPKKEYGVLNLAQKLGMDAIAITDHGNMFGAIDFFKKAKSGGVKPLVGCETYIAPYEAQNKESHRLTGRTAYHLLLLCMNNEGYKNLSHLVTYGHFEGFYYRPRIDKAMLRKHAKGLIGTSSCLAGEICQHLIKGRDEEALAIAKEYAEIFEGRFYIELQKNGLELQEQMNPKLVKIARELGLGLVATNDVHYMTQEDAEAQDALMAIQTRKSLSDPTRLKHEVQEFYLKSPEQMWELFADYPEACENTVKIAEMCDVDILPKGYFFPRLETEAGMTNDDALAKEAQEGMEARLATLLPRKPPEKHEEIRANYQERLDYELRVVKQMGFADYFRIVADFINWAKNNDIPVGPGRGSAAGSLVAYCTRITDVDPIEHDLLFERFLNPERVSMPDIDVDFCEAQREKVIEYVRQRYAVPGGPAVSQIITFGKLKAKAVLKDVGRAMDMSFSETDRLAKLIPNVLNITLDEAIRQEPRLQQEIKNHPQVAKLFDIAKRLEGLNRHASVHAAGVVISDGRPLVEHLPLYKGSNDEVVTQFDMKGVETIGLIKFDFLGLKNLTLIKHCLEMVEKNRGQKILLDQIDLEDKEVFKLLCAADTLGVFQLESSGMRQLITRLRPSCFEDVIALVALYRPGPLKSGMADSFIRRKHGEEEIDFIFDVLEPVLKSTYGVCIYQEQVMQIANILASYSLGEADLLRRAMGKKDAAEMERQRGRFLEGSEKNQHDREKAADLFGKVEKFAEYGFNRCLVPETRIMDAQRGEWTTIGDLYERPRPFFIHALGEDWRLRSRRVVDVIANGEKPVFTLKTRLGNTITATGNHPFRTLEGWTLLEDLKEGDRIAAPRQISTQSEDKWPDYQLITLGCLLSEGNLCHPSSVYFYSNQPEQIRDFAEAVQQFPDTKAKITQRNDGRMEVCANTGRLNHFGMERAPSARWHSSEGNAALQYEVCEEIIPIRSGVFRWIDYLGLHGCKATEKSIPPKIFSLCHENIALLLGRMWAGDGYIAGKGDKTEIPFYATSSEKLAWDVKNLLLILGMTSRVKEKQFKYRQQTKQGFTVTLTGDNAQERFLEVISPHCTGRKRDVQRLQEYLSSTRRKCASKDTIPPSIKKMVDEERKKRNLTWASLEKESGLTMREFYGSSTHKKGFRRETIKQLAQTMDSKPLEALSTSDVYWDTIVSITPQGMRETFDLTVENDHNFVAEGLIVHNSHSAAYGLIAYQTAWLKAHYRHEYMAALLTADAGNSDKILLYLNDCRQHHVEVLPPDVNESSSGFAVIGEKIRFALAGIKGIGDEAIKSILDAREKEGPFTDLYNFCKRVDLKRVNRRVIEALIKCGAFDSLGHNRASLIAVVEDAIQYGQRLQKEKDSQQISLFMVMAEAPVEQAPTIPKLNEWSEKERLQHEKETLGFYISGHPLRRFEKDLKRFSSNTIADLEDSANNAEATIAGIVTTKRDMTTKKGDRMAFVTIEDMTGSIEISVFPRVFSACATLLESEEPLLVRGQIERDENQIRMRAEEIRSLVAARNEKAKEVHLHLDATSLSDLTTRKMFDIFQKNQGSCTTFIHLTIPRRSETLLRLAEEIKVEPTEAFEEAIESLFGPRVISLR